MATAARESKKKYTAKSQIQYGTRNEKVEDPKDPTAVDTKVYEPGDKIELTVAEAHNIRHALFDPPPLRVGMQAAAAREDDDLEDDEDPEEQEEALESIRRRPDNPNSGVQLHWKTDRIAVDAANRIEQVRSGQADAKTIRTGAPARLAVSGHGLNEPFTSRPASNLTDMEREELEAYRKAAGKKGGADLEPPAAAAVTPAPAPAAAPKK